VVIRSWIQILILEILNAEKWRAVEIQVTGHSLCEFVHDLYVAEIPDYRSAADNVGLSSLPSTRRVPEDSIIG